MSTAPRAARLALLCLALCFWGFVRPPVQAQTGEWAWMGGSKVIPPLAIADPGPPGVYGIQGSPDAMNVPGGRYYAVSWTDKQGNFWLFGGAGEDANESFGSLNDLWEFNVTTKEWTWMTGSSTIPGYNGGQPGIYGAMLTPAKNNTPGGRTGAFGWTDQQGNLWLFGGGGVDAAGKAGELNDLWEYNVASGEWAWMGGCSTVGSSGCVGVYGTLGSLTSGSYPGGRSFGVAWTDNEGDFWMFGGYADMNDLWKFVPSTRQWAWMSGSSTAGSYGVYGQLGTPASGNTPGARDSSTAWVDASGNLWLFGGIGYATMPGGGSNNAFLNDLWEFSPSLNEWAWMGGSDQITNGCHATNGSPCGSLGVYGTLGTPSASNIPGARFGSVAWTDSAGNAWLMGGNGFGATDTGDELNDLWEFYPATNEWAWMGGPSAVSSGGESGVYGTLGVAGAGNIPGGRDGAAAWTGADGNLWLIGGEGPDANGAGGVLNDLWEYQAPAATPTLSVASGMYTSVQTVTLSDSNSAATIYYTTNGTAPTTSSTVYSAPITVSASETIEAFAVVNGSMPSAVSSATYTINLPSPTFTLAASPTSLTINSRAQGSTTLTVTPLNGFNSTVSLACSGLPAGATCSFNPPAVTPSGSAASTQMTIAIPAQARLEKRGSPWVPGSTLVLATCFLVWRRRKIGQLSAVLLVAFLSAGFLSGCAQVLSFSAPPTPVTSTVTVTATSGRMQQTTTVMLTVN